LTPGGEAIVVVASMLFVLAVAAFAFLSGEVARQAEARRDLVERGVDVSADVVRLWRTSGDSHQPRVAYRYATGSDTYEGESRIALASWRTLAVGSSIRIRYSQANPRVSVLAGREPQALPIWVPILVSAALVAVGTVCLVWPRRQWRLLRDGRAAPAIVTKVVKHHTQHGATFRSIAYSFALLSGATATGKTLTSRTPPEIGSVMCVLHDPDEPARNAPYPLKLVRLVS
jgi:hypothetical protein